MTSENTGTIRLYRKPDLMLMARSFKIYVDNQLVDQISMGESKTLEIPAGANELKVKVMNYSCKALPLQTGDNGEYVIRQNLLSNILTYCMILLALAYFIPKYSGGIDLPILLYLAIPFVGASFYYSTFGSKRVIQLKKK